MYSEDAKSLPFPTVRSCANSSENRTIKEKQKAEKKKERLSHSKHFSDVSRQVLASEIGSMLHGMCDKH